LSVLLPVRGAQVHALRLEPAGEQRQHRLVAQLVVVADVLVAEGDADDPLPDQGPDAVLHLVLLAFIHEACSDPPDQADRAIGVPSSSPPPSELTAPPSNAATTAAARTLRTRAVPRDTSVGIGPRSRIR
jgi:hypothetical protein